MSQPRSRSPRSSDVVAEARSERGAVVLRRRTADGALELRVNGVFVMDDRETATERLLAHITLDRLADTAAADAADAADTPGLTGSATDTAGLLIDAPRPAAGWHVLVGGLGLGFTLAEVLASPRVESAVVAEIEGAIVEWHRAGLVPGSLLHDERVTVEVADIRDVVRALDLASVDLILLDVDNGPGFLVYDDNAAVYGSVFLESCRDALVPGGVLAVWSADHAPDLVEALDSVFGSSLEHALPVTLGTRHTTYHLFLASRLR
ncbi:MAG: hypothetical protein WAK18_10300 [Nocardioidaceae bacterium]